MPLTFFFRLPWFRRAVWGLASVLVLWLLAWALIPPLLKHQLESRGSEALGRKLHIGAIDFKPWTLELTVTDITLASADGAHPQISIGRIYLDAELESVLRMAPVMDAITVDAPVLHLSYLGHGQYDVDDLVARLSAPTDTPAAATPKFALYNLTLNAGAVELKDRSAPIERLHSLRDVHLAVPFLSNLDAQREVKVSPHLAFSLNGSAFDSAAEATPFAPGRKGEAEVKIAAMNLAPYLSYWPAGLPLQLKGAVLDLDLRLNFEQAQTPHLNVTGAVKVSALKVADSAGAEVLEVASMAAVLADVRPLEQVVKLASFEVMAPKLQATRDQAGRINLDWSRPGVEQVAIKNRAGSAGLKRAGATKDLENMAEKSPSPWRVELAHFALHQGEVGWSDDSTAAPTRLVLAELELQADGVRWPLADPARFEGSATVSPLAKGKGAEKAARLTFKGEGTAAAGTLQAHVGDVALGLAAPYVAQYLEPRVVGVLDADALATWGPKHGQLVLQRLALRNLAMLADKASEKTSDSEWPKLKLLEVTDATLDLTAHTVQVAKVALHAPTAALRRDAQGQWMWTQWFKNTPPESAAPTAPPHSDWKFSVGDLVVDEGRVSLEDRSLSKPVRLELSELKLQAQRLTADGAQAAPLVVSARVRSGRVEPGSLTFQGTAMWSPVVVQGSLQAQDIPAHALAPYFADQLNMELLRADASFTGQLRYAATPAGAEVRVEGDAALEDFRANSAGEELLSWKSFNVPGVVLAIAPGSATRVAVREAALTDFYARVIVSPQGRINLQDLVKQSPSETRTAPLAAPAAIVQMGPISLVKGKVLFSDRFIQPNYSADLSELTGKLGQFSSQAKEGVVPLADLDLRGRAEGTASLEIVGKVNPLAQPMALDVTGKVRELELPPLSPYAIKYAGYGIERGKLSVDVNYKVQPDGQLTASNQLVLNQLVFGDKVEGAPNSLPVKLAVALLADRNGVIDINLPISGSLSDPQFSLGAVVWKALGNLVVKAVTAPFHLLASALGGAASGGDELSSVAFAPGTSELGSDAQKNLDQLAQVLNDRPALTMTVVGTASLAAEREALKAQRLKHLLLAEKRRRAVVGGGDAAAVSGLDDAEVPALLRAVYRRADIPKPRNMVGLTKDLAPADMEAILLASMTVNDDAMRELALQRGLAVKDYLASRQLPAERLFLGAAKALQSPPDWTPRAELSLSGR